MKYIGAEERKALFGTPVLTRQIVKFCENSNVTKAQILELFADQKAKNLKRTLRMLKGKGWIMESDGRYKATFDGVRAVESDADRLWKAARYMRVFTVADLMKMTGLDRDYAYEHCRTWKKLGAVKQTAKMPGSWCTYQIVCDRISRPVAGRKYGNHRYEK